MPVPTTSGTRPRPPFGGLAPPNVPLLIDTMNDSDPTKPKTKGEIRSGIFRSLCLLTLLLLSGFCGISYEILYARILGNLIGDQFAVCASILLSFLLGIGVGTLYAHNLWRFLWLVEAGIGLYGAGFALGQERVGAWFYSGGSVGLVRILFGCCVLLGLPSFLIGCSLPLFAGYLGRLSSGRVFAKAYTLYNFGAAATTLLIEFWMLRLLGLRNTVLSMAALNLLVSMLLLAGFWDLRTARPAPQKQARLPMNQWLALALVSLASAVFQLLMIKIAECLLGPFRETFALVLCVVLLGIAVGSAFTERFQFPFQQIVIANLIGLGWLVGGFELVSRVYAAYHPMVVESYFVSVGFKLLAVVILMGLPAVSFGATIPSLLTSQRDVARDSGRLLFISSVANAVGFVLMIAFLHRHFDYGVLILIVAAFSALSFTVYCQWGWSRILMGLAMFLAIVATHRALWNENQLYLGYTSFDSSDDLREASAQMIFPERFRGPQDVFSINRTQDDSFFFINGFISIPLNSPAEKVVGAFASLFSPRTDQALVLGVGSGGTAGTVGLLFDHTEAVEINPVVLENLYRMADDNFQIQSRPRVQLILDDAIHFTKASQKQYSLILNTVTTPLYFSSSKLYTKDFLEVVRQRLTPDGVYVTWFDTRVGDRGADIILKTLSHSFKECWIGCIKSGYFLLVCSQQKLAVQQPRLISDNAVLNHYFFNQNGLRPDWIPYGLLSTQAFDLIHDRSAPINTLDYPALEFEIARLGREGFDEFLARLQQQMSVKNVAEAVQPPMPFKPVDLALYVDELIGNSAITDRWKSLVSLEEPAFDQNYNQAVLDYYQDYAKLADTADAHHKWGYRLLKKGRYGEALREFSRALEINPKRNNSYFNMGACYEYMREFDLALKYYAKELTVDPNDPDVLPREGRVLYKAGRYREALACLDAALLKSPRGNTYYYRGLALEALGFREEAEQSFKEALRLNAQDEEASKALARVMASPPKRPTS